MAIRKILLMLVVVGIISFVFAREISNPPPGENKRETGVTLINDSAKKVELNFGSDFVSLNAEGGQVSISCNLGETVKLGDKVLFEIREDMCGTTINLSEHL